MQTWIVGAIVSMALVQVVWTLMPAWGRRRLARWLLSHSAPGAGHWRVTWRQWLGKHSQSGGGCACSGCDAGRPARPGTPATIQLYRRPPKN